MHSADSTFLEMRLYLCSFDQEFVIAMRPLMLTKSVPEQENYYLFTDVPVFVTTATLKVLKSTV